MNFYGQVHANEPPGGDYVRYIESLVGDPPEDAERAAVELTQRLASREPMNPPLDLSIAQTPAGTAAAGRRTPAIAAGIPTPTPATTVRRVPGLREGFSRVLIVIGALLIGLGFLAPEAISMLPGIVLLVAGFAIGRRATPPRSGNP